MLGGGEPIAQRAVAILEVRLQARLVERAAFAVIRRLDLFEELDVLHHPLIARIDAARVVLETHAALRTRLDLQAALEERVVRAEDPALQHARLHVPREES